MAASEIKSLQTTIFETAKVIQIIEDRYKLTHAKKEYPQPLPKNREFLYTSSFLSAISLLGARKSGWQPITACAIEMDIENPKISSRVTIRLAQNTKEVAAEDLVAIQDMINNVVTFVNGPSGDNWGNLRGQKMAQYELIASFGMELLPAIVHLCMEKIATKITRHKSQFSNAWSQILSKASPSDNLEEVQTSLQDFIIKLRGVGGNDRMEEIVSCITSATQASLDCSASEATINRLWKKVLEGSITSNRTDKDNDKDDIDNDNNEDETGDKIPCFILRFTKKIAGYYHAGVTITKCLLLLRRKLNFQPVSVHMVCVPPILGALDISELNNAHPTFMAFKDSQLRTGLLCPQSQDYLSSAFQKRSPVPIYVHAEVKLVLFYCTHPELFPVTGIIGVSKYCCWLCDKFLKFIQQRSPPYMPETTGYRISCYVKGCHERIYCNWQFPLPDREDTKLSQCNYDLLVERLRLVAVDLRNVLKDKAEDLLNTYCGSNDEASESSGHEEYEEEYEKRVLKAILSRRLRV